MARVLLIRFTWMGDVALVSSAGHALSSMGHRVHLLTRKGFGQLFDLDPHVHALEVDPRMTFAELLRMIRGNYDAVVDLQAKALSVALAKLSGARSKVIYRKRLWERRAGVWFKKPVRFVPVHQLYCDAGFRAVGEKSPCPEPKLFPPTPEFSLPTNFVALAPGAKHPNRQWPWFNKLARLLQGTGLKQVWLGLKSEGPDRVPGLDLRGKTTISQLLAVVSRARVLVSGDTGPMHLARATGVPVVALFGPTLPEFGFGPLPGQGIVLQRQMDCRPCSLHGEKPCPGKLECLSGISPGQVLSAVLELADQDRAKFPANEPRV